MKELLIIAMSLIIGGIPTGFLLGKLMAHTDIRSSGSGNIGTTNAFRTLGRKIGALTFLGDLLKGFLTVKIGLLLQGNDPLIVAYAVFFVVLGHCYSPFLGFSGGKGVATICGIGFALYPLSAVVGLVLFALVVWKTKYVSAGSMISLSIMGAAYAIFFPLDLVIKCAFVSAVLVALFRHRSNLKRLMNGTENQIGVRAHE